jgi:hypothetical protein
MGVEGKNINKLIKGEDDSDEIKLIKKKRLERKEHDIKDRQERVRQSNDQ